MSAGSQRSIPLDFFRGLAMLMIVVDHIGGSILSRFTLHAFAFPDAAEAFVFLSGYALASAWMGWFARRPEDAGRRLLRRAWPIYRGFLICAGVMLLVGGVFKALAITAPNLAATDIGVFLGSPGTYLIELLTLQRQPYLASVLPMYLMFVLAAPAVIPFVLRRPVVAFVVSVLVWSLAAGMLVWLPSVNEDGWEFNPFAWQWIFVIGIIGRSAAVHGLFDRRRVRVVVGCVALVVAVGCAVWRIWVDPGYLDPELKQNLSALRVVNFVAIAWLCAWFARLGWIDRCASRVRWITLIGRQSLPCFIAGGGISLVIDSVLFSATRGYLDYPAGLLADGVAMGALVGFALLLNAWRGRVRTAVSYVPVSREVKRGSR
jgi:hypothetical protein